MKLSNTFLTDIEQRRNLIVIQSSYPEITYAIDRRNKAMYILNRQTGQELQIAAENIYSFAFELMDVADLYVPQQNLFRKGA